MPGTSTTRSSGSPTRTLPCGWSSRCRGGETDTSANLHRMATALVSGGAGFIGSHLCDRLLAEGHRVVAVDDLTKGRIANLAEARGYGKQFTFTHMDIRSEGIRTLVARHKPDVLYHLAEQVSVHVSLGDPLLVASVTV